jgi:hypothetical protein
MIPVKPAPEPPEFNERVRIPGNRAIAELTGSGIAVGVPGRRSGPPRKNVSIRKVSEIKSSELTDYWTHCLPQLCAAYGKLCAYLAMRLLPAIAVPTVDHFKPKSKYQHLTYEWTNYRLSSHGINANKGDFEDVLDPFTIQSGWFVLNLGTFKVHPGNALTYPQKEAVESTIARLKLNEPTYCDARKEYHDQYLGLGTYGNGTPRIPLPLAWLENECPFVAYELRRQKRLKLGDS